LPAIDDLSTRTRFGLNQRHLIGDRHVVRYLSHLQTGVYSSFVANFELNIFSDKLLKAIGFHFQLVPAGNQEVDDESARVIRGCGGHNMGLCVDDRDLRVRNRRARGIGYLA